MGITLAERPAVTAALTSEELDLVRKTVANGATDAELKLFLFDCQRRGVHPLDKLLHFTKRGGRYTPVTSIDFMRAQAAMTGEMAGSDDPIFNATDDGLAPISATVSVYRITQGQRFAYTATARWAEYCPDNAPMWKRMPHTMLGKCAEALALRKAFPHQLQGLYAREEMDQAGDGLPSPLTPDPPATVINVQTGESVPATAKPEPPAGYRYIDQYHEENGWHHVTFHGMDAQGGAITFKTKLAKLGDVACQAYHDGVPVRVEGKAGRVKDERWLDKIEMWKAETPAREPLDGSLISF